MTGGSRKSTSPIEARVLRDDLVPQAVAVNKSVGRRLTAAESRTLHRLLAKLVAEPAARRPLQRDRPSVEECRGDPPHA